MNKVQKIREEIAKKLEVMQYQVHRKDAYKELKGVLDYIDFLQEEPVSKEIGDYDHKAVMEALHPELKEKSMNEELEKAAKYFIPDESYHMIIESEEEGSGENVYDYVQMIEMFKAGAQWQKEQMMTKAFDGEILENYDGKVIKYDDTILDEKLSDCKVFDKVKIIVIKEG